MTEDQEQEKTVEQEVEEEIAKQNGTDDESGEGAEVKAEEEFLDLTKDEVVEEKKFQEVSNAAEALDKIETPATQTDNVNEQEAPNIEPAKPNEQTESTEDKEVPTETANIIKDQRMVFIQYECDNPKCGLKFYINNADENKIGDNLKCYYCKKKLANKRRNWDVTLNKYVEIPRPVVEKKVDEDPQ